MNFDKLPCDIKRKIFDYNRAEVIQRRKELKERYDNVMDELQGQVIPHTHPDRHLLVFCEGMSILNNIRDTRYLLYHQRQEWFAFHSESDEEWMVGSP